MTKLRISRTMHFPSGPQKPLIICGNHSPPQYKPGLNLGKRSNLARIRNCAHDRLDLKVPVKTEQDLSETVAEAILSPNCAVRLRKAKSTDRLAFQITNS